MILINLLPHREETRKRRKQVFNTILVLSAVAGLALGGLAYGYYQLLIAQQESVNTYIQNENTVLDNKIKDIQGLESEISSLRERQQAVEDLQQQRNDPVNLFNELSSKLPDGLYLTNIKQVNEVVNIAGVAQSNERVSEYLRNLKDSPLWQKSPQLDETAATEVQLAKGKGKAYTFKMTLTLKKPEKPSDKKGVPAAQPGADASKG